MGFIVSVVVSLRCLPLHNRVRYLLKESILWGSFNNYVDQIVISWQYFANFDPSTPSEDNCGHFTWYLPVMSPSRAEGFSARLGSWPFFIQLEIKNWPKMSWTFDFVFMIHHSNKIWLKIMFLKCNIKLQKYQLKCPSSARLGIFLARTRLSQKIPARTHLYYLPSNHFKDLSMKYVCTYPGSCQ